jgi:hypothetical protein
VAVRVVAVAALVPSVIVPVSTVVPVVVAVAVLVMVPAVVAIPAAVMWDPDAAGKETDQAHQANDTGNASGG